MPEWLARLEPGWTELLALAGAMLGPVLSLCTIVWVLFTKKNSISAVAWVLLVLLLPLVGPLFFLVLGDQHVHRKLNRKRKHRKLYHRKQTVGETGLVQAPTESGDTDSVADGQEGSTCNDFARLARRFGAFPITTNNHLDFYFEGQPAMEGMLRAIADARHHVHLETFIFQNDDTGRAVLDLLTTMARHGIQVRLLFDAMGTRNLNRRLLEPLRAAGGKAGVFLPLNPWRRRIQVNMRNHRKITVVDGRVGFTGGMNVGDEYLSKSARFGYSRDTHIRLEGPAVIGLQSVFIEDWDFASGELLTGSAYYPQLRTEGPFAVQVIESGPDREQKGIREMYFAATLRARKRLWIASPYFVPDAGLLDALCLAGNLGVDVRLLCQFHPDKWIPLCAARYYFNDVLRSGVKVYQYAKGMMHSKVVLVDGEWASVGSANFDNRSLHLNFEANCLIYSPQASARLEAAFLEDLSNSIRLERHVFARRPLPCKIVDNACRLLSPVL